MNQVMIVTGGSRGIGAAVARLAGRRGYAVCVNYVSDKGAADETAAAIESAGGKAIAVQCNVASEHDIVRLFRTVDQELGAVTALVNNAGIVNPQSRLEDMSAERINDLLAINITGSMLCAREAVRRMSTRHGGPGGAIVNLSSAAARLGSPGEFVDYGASKGAIDTFTRGLALEVAEEGIRVNAVRPGLIDTEIHASAGMADRVARLAPVVPVKRAGSAEEVANAILWLASDEASYVTGAIIDVSGGR